MATLNTLRTKGGVVVAIVIGISLLAFLLGDLATSGGALMGSSQMNVGEINGKTITYQDYLNKVEQLTSVQQIATGRESLDEEQTTAIRANAWEQITRENAFNGSLVDLGLLISDDEALDMADGEFVSPIVSQLFQNPETGLFDQNEVRRYVTTLDEDATGRKRFFWNYIESEMTNERSMSKYMALVQNAVFTNNIEIENAVKAANTTYSFSYTGKSLSTIADSLVKVSEADYKKYYDTHKNLFKQLESREIEYVVFESLPSADDYATADKAVQTLATEFAATEDVEQFVSLNSQSKFDPSYYSANELPEGLKDFAFTASNTSMYGPILESDKYTMARVIDVKDMPDTVAVRQIILASTDTKLADSILQVLKSKPSEFDVLLAQYSLDKQTPGGDLGRINPRQLGNLAEVADKLYNSKQGEVFIAKSPYGIHVMENTYRGPLSKKAKVGVVEYGVEASERTIQDAFNKATTFVNSAKGKNGDFDKAVEESALSKRVARLRAGDNAVSGINQSHEIVRWAFGAKTGAVSDVISIGESNIVVRVANSQEHGYAKLENIKKDILPEIQRQKKIELLSAEFSGSSLSDVSSKLGTDIKDVSDINFNAFFIPELGIAQRAIGLASTVAENTLSKPIEAGNDVIVMSVTGRTTVDETNFETQKVVTETAEQTDVFGRVYNAVFNMADIKDSRIKFF